MAKIPVSYQPNKIKKGSYTDWIDGGKFCTTTNPNGSDTPPTTPGLNLLDAFDVDWSAYKLGGLSASANKIIEKLNEQLLLPQSPDRLIYYNEGEGFVSDYLVLNDGTLVVDNDPDLDLCKGKSDIETDILGAWQLWTEIKSASPEYGTGTYTTNLGYGRWYTNANGEVLNKVNSTDFNGYIMPFARLSYAIESILGTNIGNTTGDNIGFSIVNDKNAVPRHVITNSGRTYYRNTLYDIYADGASGESAAIHPIKSAWVCDDKASNTAYVIYTTSPTSGAEANLSGDHLVYYIDNIKTSQGRRKYKTADLTTDNSVGKETVTANNAASGTIDFISITVTNSKHLSVGHGVSNEDNGGTIYVFGSRYNVSSGTWLNETVFMGTTDALGNLLVAFDESLDTNVSGKACIIKTYVDVNKGVLTIKFSDSTKYGETPTYNDSVLKIDFTKKKYYITPRKDYENLSIVENSLPTSTLNSDFWDGFTNDTKFMYHAFSYLNLYIKCLNVLMDNKIIYVHDDGTNIEFGPNADRSDYEAKGNISTQNVLKGSRLVYNSITKKTFYSDGVKIFHIASVNVDDAGTEDTPVTGEYLPLAGGEMLGHIDMLDSSIIWDDWNSSIGELGSQLVITGGEGLIFNGGQALFSGDIIPSDSMCQNIGSSDKLFNNLYVSEIFPDIGLVYTDLIDDGRSIITINDSTALGVAIDESGTRTFTLGARGDDDCFVVNSDAFDINCAAGGTNIYGYLSILDSDEGPYAELSISEGALKISNSTNIQGGLHSTASATYSNVLLGINNPGANETGFTDMGTDTMANGYPLVISTVDSKDGACLVFGPGDIYALKKNSAGTGYLSSTLYLQHRSDYYGDVLIGKNLQVGDINSYGGTGGNLTVKGYAEAKDGFKKTGSTNDYVLLAGGGTALLSSIQGSGGTVTSITPGTGLTGASNNDSAITTSGTINLKSAGTSEIGGIKVKAINANAVTSATEGTNYYPVNIDSNGLGYVALPAFKTSDNNTTYTFKSGTNGFTVTPSGGTALTVTVTPSITNNITGSGTSGCLAKFNGANTLTSGPKLGSDKTKFLRNDGEWAVPTGTGVTGDYLPLAGGEMSGSICMNSNPITFDLDAFCQIYEDSGLLHIESDEGIVLSNQVTIGSEALLVSSQDGSALTISCEGITLQAGDEVTLATGCVTSTGSVHAPSFFETSDIRKKNIKSDLPLDKCYELIDKCQTVIYSLKDQTQEQIGMIAQEVEEFFPEVVATDPDGFKSLAYDRLVVICFKVLKDVIKRLEKLENE